MLRVEENLALEKGERETGLRIRRIWIKYLKTKEKDMWRNHQIEIKY